MPAAEDVTVQVTSFKVPELSLGLATLDLTPEGETAYYESLARLAATGEIEIVLDHRVSMPSGMPAKTEANSYFFVPTEYEPLAGSFLLCPTAFEARNLGTSVQVEAFAGSGEFSILDWQGRPTRMLDLNLTVAHMRFNGLRPLTIPNTIGLGPSSGTQLLPSFLAEKILSKVSVFSDQPMLIGLTRPADLLKERSGGKDQQVIITFARASASPIQAPVKPEDDSWQGASPPLRLHWLTLRLPRHAASKALWESKGGSAETLRREWLGLVKEGQAFVISHAAVATRSGNSAQVAGVTEIPFVEEWRSSLLPQSYQTRHAGTTWQVEPTLSADSRVVDITVSTDETSAPIWREVSASHRPSTHPLEIPDFSSTVVRTSLAAPLGETRILGAVTPTSEQVPRGVAADWVDVALLHTPSMPRRLTAAESLPPIIKAQPVASIAIFSVDEVQAQALETVQAHAEEEPEDITQAVAELWDAAAAGEVSLTAFASLAQRSGSSSRTWAVREWATLTEASFEHAPSNPDILPSKAAVVLKTVNAGTSWDVRCIEDGEGGSVDLKFVHDVAPPVLVPFAAGAAARDAGKNPGPQATAFAFSFEAKTRYTSGLPQLLAIEESPAPSGHPDHGRWLVAVLKVTGEE